MLHNIIINPYLHYKVIFSLYNEIYIINSKYYHPNVKAPSLVQVNLLMSHVGQKYCLQINLPASDWQLSVTWYLPAIEGVKQVLCHRVGVKQTCREEVTQKRKQEELGMENWTWHGELPREGMIKEVPYTPCHNILCKFFEFIC